MSVEQRYTEMEAHTHFAHRQQAPDAGDAIADEETRSCFDGDLNGGNWGVLA